MNPFRPVWLGSWVLERPSDFIDTPLTDTRQIDAAFMLGGPDSPWTLN